jgi:nitrogen fixation NifU-like protein
MTELGDLYQEIILDHGKRPRNFRRPETVDRKAEGDNPLCGDRITVYVALENGVIVDASFEGAGCAISTASASLMSESVRGKTLEEAESLFEGFRDLVTGKADPDATDLGKLAVFTGVREYPVRIKCATLPWHTLRAALQNEADAVTTE